MIVVYIAPAQAERLVEQWDSSTNEDLIRAGDRLKDALASIQAKVASSNKAGVP